MQSNKTTPKSVQKQDAQKSPTGPEGQLTKITEILKANYQMLYDLVTDGLGPDHWYQIFVSQDDYFKLTAEQRIREFAYMERLREFCYQITDLDLFTLNRE